MNNEMADGAGGLGYRAFAERVADWSLYAMTTRRWQDCARFPAIARDVNLQIPKLDIAEGMVSRSLYHNHPSDTDRSCAAALGRTASRATAGFARG